MRAYFNEFDPVAAAWLRQLIKDGLLPEGEVDERSIKEVSPADLKGFTHCHFFAGIGGWPLALEQAGWPADRPVWTGSCPCQPYSSAGKQLGDADPRNLWPDFYRLISECRPVTVIGEQVEGAIRKGWLDRVCGDMEGAGYAVGSVVLGAHSAGAPHIRQRLFWVADAGRSGRGAGCGIAGGQDGPRVRVAEPDADGELRSVADNEEFGREQGDSHHRGRGAGIRQEGDEGGSADGGDDGELGNAPSDGRQEHERGSGPGEEPDATDAGRGPGGVGDADNEPRPQRDLQMQRRGEIQHGPDAGRPGVRFGTSVGVSQADTNGTGPQGEPAPGPGEGRAVGRAGSVGNWDDFDIVPCLDNKARRVEPGSFPLAHGVPRKLGPLFAVLVGMGIDPKRAKRLVRNAGGRLAQAGRNRVGRLRGYGNAIAPQTAAAFVRAYLDTETEGGVR